MSTTLTNGLKLPDKGSVDWYADMQNNYTILDGAVGTIAEHSTQIAGKAPLVHTHSKADITDFPAYGNTAGTICEGNDSRLSDARTPVAHTHSKSDVTDLFNSANTWTKNNTFSADCIVYNSDSSGSTAGLKLRNSKAEVLSTGNTSSDQSMTFRDKNDVAIGYVKGAVQSASVALKIGAYAKDSSNNTVNTELQLLAYSNGNKAIIPSTTNSYDLGSSSYQWNNIYSKGYYYNGVAWGLDKANEWSDNNIFSKNAGPASVTSVTDTTLAFNGLNNTIFLNTRGSSNRRSYGSFLFVGYGTASGAENYGQIQLLRSTDKRGDTNEGYVPDTSFKMWRIAPHSLIMDSMEAVRVTNDGTENSLKPITDNTTDLGTSDNKWKSLNGVNPGALSFPEGTTSNANTTFNPDLTNWLKDGTAFTITAQVTGWLYIRIQNDTGNFAWVKRASAGDNQTWGIVGNSDTNSDIVNIPLNVPVVQGYTYTLKIKSSRVSAAIFMCLGNV